MLSGLSWSFQLLELSMVLNCRLNLWVVFAVLLASGHKSVPSDITWKQETGGYVSVFISRN